MKQGFTLSEVLITLGVVGIVAVLTIPGVMKNYQNRLYTAQLQKIYAQIADAAQSIMNDEHVDNFYETTAGGTTLCKVTITTGSVADTECTNGLGYLMENYFKLAKSNCMRGTEPCLNAGVYKTIGGDSVSAISGEYFAQTVTGAVIGGAYNTANKCLSLIVDVNGAAEPNVAGRDVFAIDIRSNGTLADYGSGCKLNNTGEAASTCTKGPTSKIYTAVAGCLNNIIEAGWKMEY